jgi:NADH:ubiquinone oxidoreductase subunit 2 (subunit N)
MVTAVIAGYFYLRLAVLMYAGSSLGDGGDGASSAHVDQAVSASWDTPEAVSGTVTALNREILLTAEPAAPFGEEEPSVVPVPAMSGVAIALSVAVSVVFGVWPGPLVDFAHSASLLFIGH